SACGKRWISPRDGWRKTGGKREMEPERFHFAHKAGSGCEDQYAVQPASAVTTVPFTKLASSEARNSAIFAISSGWPVRGLLLAPDIALPMPNWLGLLIV